MIISILFSSETLVKNTIGGYFTAYIENSIKEVWKYYFGEVSEKISERCNVEIQNTLDQLEINPNL